MHTLRIDKNTVQADRQNPSMRNRSPLLLYLAMIGV